MKRLICLFFCLVAFALEAISQGVPEQLPDATTSLKVFQKEVEFAIARRDAGFDICKRAFASRRVDLVGACFRSSLIFPFSDSFQREPDSPFKDMVVLMMLEGPSEAWLDEGRKQQGPRFAGVHHSAIAALIRPVLQKYIPANELADDLFLARESRLVLAKNWKKHWLREKGNGQIPAADWLNSLKGNAD